MKRVSTVFLQAVIVVIGIGALAFLLWLPRVEGRNVQATNFEIYFKDPFLAYAYLGSIAFFAGLYQAFRLLGYMANRDVFSARAVKALGMIKKCALVLAAFILGAEIYIFVFVRGKDDVAGGVMMGLVLIFISAVVATVAAVFERTLKSAVEMKAENDLTV
jgi:hypothetical protein